MQRYVKTSLILGLIKITANNAWWFWRLNKIWKNMDVKKNKPQQANQTEWTITTNYWIWGNLVRDGMISVKQNTTTRHQRLSMGLMDNFHSLLKETENQTNTGRRRFHLTGLKWVISIKFREGGDSIQYIWILHSWVWFSCI